VVATVSVAVIGLPELVQLVWFYEEQMRGWLAYIARSKSSNFSLYQEATPDPAQGLSLV